LVVAATVAVLAGCGGSDDPKSPVLKQIPPYLQGGFTSPHFQPTVWQAMQLVNTGKKDAVVDHVDLIGGGGVEVLDARALVPGTIEDHAVNTVWPPRPNTDHDVVAIKGAHIPPDQPRGARIELYLLRTAPGPHHIGGLSVSYHVGDKHFTQQFTATQFCLTDTKNSATC
jgi:hypothetical protein